MKFLDLGHTCSLSREAPGYLPAELGGVCAWPSPPAYLEPHFRGWRLSAFNPLGLKFCVAPSMGPFLGEFGLMEANHWGLFYLLESSPGDSRALKSFTCLFALLTAEQTLSLRLGH